MSPMKSKQYGHSIANTVEAKRKKNHTMWLKSMLAVQNREGNRKCSTLYTAWIPPNIHHNAAEAGMKKCEGTES